MHVSNNRLEQQRAQRKMLVMQAVVSLLGRQQDRGKQPATQPMAALHGHQPGAVPLQFVLPSGGGTSVAGLGLTGRGVQASKAAPFSYSPTCFCSVPPGAKELLWGADIDVT